MFAPPPINTTNTKQIVENCEFTVDLNKPEQQFCAYLHIVESVVMYAGSCEFRALLEAPDARRNRLWRQQVGTLPRVTIKVMAIFEMPHEAVNYARQLARTHKAYCNLHGEQTQSTGRVRCKDDGLEFDNAATAARFYGFAPGTMSNHLNRRKGYLTIRNMTFERIAE